MDDELISDILMVLSFVPVGTWLILTGWEYTAHRWVRPFFRAWVLVPHKKNLIFDDVAQYSQGARIRQNQRVLR